MRTAVVVFVVCALLGCASMAWSNPGSAPGQPGADIEENFSTHLGFVHVTFFAERGYVVMQDHWSPYEWSDIIVFQEPVGHPLETDIYMVCHLNGSWGAVVAEVNAPGANKVFIPEGTNGLSVYWPDGPEAGTCYSFQSEADEGYVPEPASFAVLGLGLLATAIRRRRSA